MLHPSSGRPARAFQALVVSALLSAPALGQGPPPGYYDTVDATDAASLRQTLHDVIDDHLRYPYTSSSTDTWDILELADEDPGDAASILDVYRNRSFAKAGGGNPNYNREHTWPSSYGFPDDSSSNYPYSDCFQLRLCDDGYNSARSNKPFRYCAGCTEYPTDLEAGAGGPGFPNRTAGSFTQGSWETWEGMRGDVARGLFYLDVRYEGGTHGVTFASEPDLILTDDEALIDASNTGQNEPVAYMGMLSVLLQWHAEDPVDAAEMARNDVVFSFQGNRNPFIDHPEWVDCLFNSVCGGGDVTPPAPVTGLAAVGGAGQVDLTWNANGEPDLAGYHVYRATVAGGPYGQLTGSPVGTPAYSDTSVVGGTTYYYVATAIDTSQNESGFSAEVSATPTPGAPSTDPWINEFHYDNAGGDTGEFVEVAGPSGLDLTGWQVVGYNGNGGGVYQTVALSGVLPAQENCTGTLSFAFTGMQNATSGLPDGLALVNPGGTAIEFLSYEGVFVAVGGAASGMTSVDVGVSESGSTPVGHSLQLGGTGSGPDDFAWQPAQAETPGLPNAGQTFAPAGVVLYGTGTLGSLGVPTLCWEGPPLPGTTFTLVAGNSPPGTQLFVIGSTSSSVPPLDLSNGLLLNVGIPLLFLNPLIADGTGNGSLSLFIPLGASGLTIYCQSIAVDGTGGAAYASSLGTQVDVL